MHRFYPRRVHFVQQCFLACQVSDVHEDNLIFIGEVDNQGLYNRLGVPMDADDRTITKAYRQKSLRSHPDKGGDKETWQLLNEAYEFLLGPLRTLYNECGAQGLELRKRAEPRVSDSMSSSVFCLRWPL